MQIIELCNRNKCSKCRPFVLSFLTSYFNNFFMTLNCADSGLFHSFIYLFFFLRSPLQGSDSLDGVLMKVHLLKLVPRSVFCCQLRAAPHANHKGREPCPISNGTPLPHFHIHNLEWWEQGVNKCLRRAVFIMEVGRWVGGGLLACAGQVVGGERCNAGCLFSGGQFLRLRPPPFFFPARLRNKD